MIFIVAAMSENGVIGLDGKLPWGLIEEDMRHFKRLTMGKACIAGRKTAEGLKLQGRLLITIGKGYNRNIKQALEAAQLCPRDIAVIGGAQVYEAFLKAGLVDKIYLTIIRNQYAGDTHFPTWYLDRYRIESTRHSGNLAFLELLPIKD